MGYEPRRHKNNNTLALSYSTAEYTCPVWDRSAYAHKVNLMLNDACCRMSTAD